jgi:uncharacterized phage-associated protein
MAAPYDSRGVANVILHYANDAGKKLTPMQLIKLVYLANAWSLALLGHKLINEDVQAWQYGPVIPTVYRAFNRFGSAPITDYARQMFTDSEYPADLDEDEKKVVHAVVNSYGHMHAFQLSAKMHEPNTPWTKTYNEKGPYSVIPTSLIKEHFIELKSQRQVTL